MEYRFLIASDLDGTLIKDKARGMEPGVFEMIREVRQAGGLFCAASGRSYPTLYEEFAPVADGMLFLPENGARAYWQGRLLYHVPMPRAACRELTAQICARPDCEVRLYTMQGGYYIPQTSELLARIRPRSMDGYQAVGSFDEVEGEITKISAFCALGVEEPARALLPRWGAELGGSITGAQWLDFTCAGKDEGLRRACAHFGLPLAHTAAFGDSYNDAPMLAIAGRGYLMDTAPAPLREQFPLQCASVPETVRGLLRQGLL